MNHHTNILYTWNFLRVKIFNFSPLGSQGHAHEMKYVCVAKLQLQKEALFLLAGGYVSSDLHLVEMASKQSWLIIIIIGI